MDQLNILNFGYDEKGEYVDLVAKEEAERLANWHDYPYEDLIKGHETEIDFCVVATFYKGAFSQYGMTIADIQNEINEIVASKTYHYGNMAKGIYAYSFKCKFDDGEVQYWFCIENEKHIVIIRHTGNIDDILTGKETICYPACCVYMFETSDYSVKEITSGYGNKEKDIRYKILCGEFKILEFSKNRIDPKKAPTDFYEAEYTLQDFINYWGIEKKDNNAELD